MNKKIVLRYVITLLVELVIFICLIFLRGITNTSTVNERLLIICDSFFITGVLFAGIGAIVLISDSGFFDIIGYGVKNLAMLFTPKKLGHVEYYYEYCERKKEARMRRRSLMFIFVDGLIFIVLSLLCFLF